MSGIITSDAYYRYGHPLEYDPGMRPGGTLVRCKECGVRVFRKNMRGHRAECPARIEKEIKRRQHRTREYPEHRAQPRCRKCGRAMKYNHEHRGFCPPEERSAAQERAPEGQQRPVENTQGGGRDAGEDAGRDVGNGAGQ